MSAHAEELALEQHAERELEREAIAHWKAGRYTAAREAREQLAVARARIRKLEGEER